ncbi:MAG: ABC transporter substrate-binding protein [Firmicutes bacterium]|nr:ABC transporter substrate-binding protein [Bacillota bacterium]
MSKWLRSLVFVVVLGSLILGLASISFGQGVPVPFEYATLQEYQKATGKKIAQFGEAPMLANLVKQRKLPPVKERLPGNPKVIVPVEEIGQYGGTWHRAWLGPSDAWGPRRLMVEQIIQFNADGTKIIPNIAESWEVSEGGKTFTFKLKKGIRWSDGHPFTADDIVFQYEDVLLNKELTPVFPDWLTIAGKPVVIEKVDDYTVRFRFAATYGLFLYQFADKSADLYAPKHYMKQFHPRYTPMEKLKQLAKNATGTENWFQLYQLKSDNWWVNNPDYPTIWAWKAVSPPTGTQFIMERNPYYWKVDTRGNQLPYIDRISNILVENVEMLNLKALTGELDMQWRYMQLENFTALMENREKGDYRILKWRGARGANPVIYLNYTCKDQILRNIFLDARFRKALSLAINRDEINEIANLGLGKPRQASLIPGVPYYSKEWEKAYAEYDPEKANKLLDEMGLTNRDKQGFRLRPDGKTLALTIEYTARFGPWTETFNLVKKYWEDIGIKVALKLEDSSLWTTRRDANELEVTGWQMDSQAPWLAEGTWLVPTGNPRYWGTEYARWVETGGKAGEKPEGDMAKILELWDKVKRTIDEKERDKLIEEIIGLHIRNIWLIGTVGETPDLVVVKNNFRNVPSELIADGTFDTPRNAEPQQFFIRQR